MALRNARRNQKEAIVVTDELAMLPRIQSRQFMRKTSTEIQKPHKDQSQKSKSHVKSVNESMLEKTLAANYLDNKGRQISPTSNYYGRAINIINDFQMFD